MLRFTIRDVLWLTIVVALAISNWVQRRQHAAAVHDLRHQVQVRELAAQALANVAEPEAREALRARAAVERDPMVREALTAALA